MVDTEKERREAAGQIAHEIVMTVDWPWNERQKRLWYIGVLADTGWLMMNDLEQASMDQLIEWHREIFYTR